MKKQLVLTLILIFAVSAILMASGTPRTYIQRCSLTGGGEAVMNTGSTTDPNYVVHATLIGPGTGPEVLGTDLGTPVTSIRISRLGTAPNQYTATTLQLGTFPTQWVAGWTIHMAVTYVPTSATAEWDLVIPTGGTTINIQAPIQIIPPYPVANNYFLHVTSSTTGFEIFKNTVDTGFTTNHDFSATDVANLVGTYNLGTAPAGFHWMPAAYEVTAGMFAKTDYNATINFMLEADPDVYIYNLHVNGPVGGYAVTGPYPGVTDYTATANNAAALSGDYNIATAPAGFYWVANPITVIPTMFAPVKSGVGLRSGNSKATYTFEATITFELMPIPADVYNYTLHVDGPVGHVVTGPVSGTIYYNAVDNDGSMLNSLLGDYTVDAPDAGMAWVQQTITVTTGMFTAVKNTYNYEATITFVENPLPPDVYNYTLYVNGPDGYAVTGPVNGTTDYMATDLDGDMMNTLLGDYTIAAAPAGFAWLNNPITVTPAMFSPVKATYNYEATIDFVLVPTGPSYTFEVNAYDLAWYTGSGYSFPILTPAYLDANDLVAEIWFDPAGPAPLAFTGVYTPYTFGAPAGFNFPQVDLPFIAGDYSVSHVGYASWLPESITFISITTSYALDFMGIPTVPVELSSFTATLTAQNYVQLTWVSQTESQMMGYLVYRNTTNNQSTSELIDQPMIPATNTSSTQSYTVTDNDVQLGQTYYYWLEAVDYNNSTYHGPVSVTVMGNVPPVLPEVTSMKNAYPNPFKANGSTTIEVSLKAGDNGTITIYNVLGQVVKTINVTEGNHTINWNGKDSKGNVCGSGIYFYKLSTPSMNVTKKMVIVK